MRVAFHVGGCRISPEGARRRFAPSPFAFVLALALTACAPGLKVHDYEVENAQSVPSKLSRYRSVSVEVVVAPGVPVKPEDVAAFSKDLVTRVRATKVIDEVVLAPAPAELTMRATIAEITTEKTWSVQHGEGSKLHSRVVVDLFDAREGRPCGHLTIRSTPTSMALTSLDGASTEALALRNASRAIAAQLKRHR